MEIKTRPEFAQLLEHRNMLDVAVEVGVAEGRLSYEMLHVWGIKKLYLVDLWAHVDGMRAELGGLTQQQQDGVYAACMELLKDYRDRIVVLRGWAHEMAAEVPDGSLGFCYEDSTHEYDWVLKNLRAWWPKVRPGGIMAGHDYLSPSFTVKPAVDEFAAEHGLRVHVVPEKHINDASFWFEKPT